MLKMHLLHYDFITSSIKNVLNQKKLKRIIIFLIFIPFSILGIMTLLNNFQYKNNYFKSKFLENFAFDIGFYLKNVEMNGLKYIPQQDFLNIIEKYKNRSIFETDLIKIHKEILKNNWVKNLHLERVIPNKIKLYVEENEPIAIWQNKNGNNLLTKEGVLIKKFNISDFKNKLPIITGEDADKEIVTILNILDTNKSLAKEIWSMSYVNKRRWDLHFNQGLVIRLPSENVSTAWKLAAELYQKYNILNLGLIEIDLKNPNQVLGKVNFDKKLINNRKSL